ncbi:hypothetical protein [Desulforapulum autotrophicum]|uniref:hypothetical protein n=1 Tax=Desulforapulum autotrophicum TaxID=2296 RepID=UPI0002F61619|nr:hypothetical protein [Desulforapulum autotrophicum]
MKEHSCEKCGFRAKFDNNPSSFMGRLWRWHTTWCPGWKRYVESMPEDDQMAIVDKYGEKRFYK